MTSVFLGKYKNKKRLGKGAFGDVVLVEDADGNEFALKMIKKKMLQKDPYLEEYLEGEIDCMLDVDSPYIMKLYSFEEDENFKYMVCEYCNGGDLLNHQAKQKKQVYTLEKATEILSEVIRGLQYLHDRGYVHRDIKPQNILIKYDGKGELQTPIFKLADFGFAKKFEDVGGTILGTEQYMSPEIYTSQIYGFEVDMWAFGVLFYFMLNMQYPFKINPHLPVERKRQELIKQAKGFSYGNLVKKSKKKNMENCTEEMEDLFRRIFDSDAESRIGWVEIREHPVFRKHFPVITEDSKIIYKNKAQNKLSSYIIKKQSVIVKNPEKIKNKMEAIEQQEENADISIYVGRKKHKQYPEEKNFIEMKYEKIKFLYDSQQQMTDASEVLTNQEILSFRYCMLRHYLILLGGFLKELNPDDLKKDVETYKWDDFVKTKQFRKMREEYQEHYDFVELALGHTGRICENFLDEIAKFNQPLCTLLDISFNKQTESFAQIKKPYRISTKASYSKLKDLTKKGNKYSFLAVTAVICHAFNRIVEDDENHLKELFAKYISNKEQFVDFSYIRSKLTSASEKELSELANLIYQAYF